MMRPDLRVSIAYNTDVSLIKGLKQRLDKMHEEGYPVKAYIIYTSIEDQSDSLFNLSMENFTKCDVFIGIGTSKFLTICPNNTKVIGNTPILESEELLKNKNCIVNLGMSVNYAYELGLFLATHREYQDRIFMYTFGKFNYDELRDAPRNLYSPLDCYKDDDERIDHILDTLHKRAVIPNFPYLSSIKRSSTKINNEDILDSCEYRPVLKNMLSSKNIFDSNSLYSSLDPLDQYFVNEYNTFEKNNISTFGRRLQYIADRIVLFVYLRDINTWMNFIDELDTEVFTAFGNINNKYTQSILLLRQILEYHGYMGNGRGNINKIIDNLSNINMNNIVKNPMFKCLSFNYLGLCYHKKFFKTIKCFSKSNFDVYNEDSLEIINSLSVQERRELRNILNNSINSFNYVLSLSYENGMDRTYIWEGFALYNKARCKYLLFKFFNDESHIDWESEMQKAIDIRNDYRDRYVCLPNIIHHNLVAEYFHAEAEMALYKHQPLDEKVNIEFKKWLEENIYYHDVLKVKEKFEKVMSIY